MRLTSLLVALATVSGAICSSSEALAAFVYDLRFADGSDSKVVAANQSYTLQLWGQITGDGIKNNDAWSFGYFSIDVIKQGSGAIYNPGNLSSVGISALTLGTNTNTGGVVGTQRSGFDDNVRGWGGTTGNVNSGWANWRGGTSPGFVGGTFNAQSVDLGAGGQEVLLATFNVNSGADINNAGSSSDKTVFQLRVQNTLQSGVSQVPAIGYFNDNANAPPTGTPLNFATGNVQGQTTSVELTAVPEPSTFALIALGGIGLAVWGCRRRQA